MKCFKCEKELRACIPDEWDGWNNPCGAVKFKGFGNYGSTLYDACFDGAYIEIIVCDDCLKLAGCRSDLTGQNFQVSDKVREVCERRKLAGEQIKEIMDHLKRPRLRRKKKS